MKVRSLSFLVMIVLVAVLSGAAGATMATQPWFYARAAAQAPGAAPSEGPAPASPFVAAVTRVRPAVVNISTERTVANPFADSQQFGPFFGNIPGLPSGPIHQKGIGSGVIVSPEGYILTNAHVVQGADRVTVTLIDGRTLRGTVVGADPATDLAVIKISAGDLPTAALGDSASLVPGDWAIAIGNPYGLNSTVTAGVISAVGRTLPDGPEETFIQTDAAINPGNSGGPLVNTAGQVIGINTAEFANAQGIGFAIPIDTARGIMRQLIATGHIIRPYLGVYLQPVTPDLAAAMHLPPGTHGAVVADVVAGSPAATAGLQRGDVIVEAAGKPVPAPAALVTLVHRSKIGTPLLLLVRRQGHTQYVTVKVGQMPSGK
jgi:Do/DeqQ family serine protease